MGRYYNTSFWLYYITQYRLALGADDGPVVSLAIQVGVYPAAATTTLEKEILEPSIAVRDT